MAMRPAVFVLIHSPLVGPLTWSRVAAELVGRGYEVVRPVLNGRPAQDQPFWQVDVAAAARQIQNSVGAAPLILAGHSGAGPLLPAIRQALPNPVAAYLFVDAGIPQAGASRLDLMRAEDPAWAAGFAAELTAGAAFPNWRAPDLAAILPDEALRQQLVAELQPRSLPFFTEPIPVFAGWPDAPVAVVQFSPPYERSVRWAEERSWPAFRLPAGHFHMLVDPVAVADAMLAAANL